MIIDLHVITWNESDIIRLVLRHYKKFCRNLYVYDNHSTDNTREIAESEGAIVSLFGTKFFDDSENMKLKNTCWIGSDADWVIVCDADEILSVVPGVIPNTDDTSLITGQLWFDLFMFGKSIIKTIGWQIMSDEMPKENITEITNGYEFSNYAKSIAFSPKHIEAVNFNPGAHRCDPVGYVEFTKPILYVLHYKHIGGVQRTIDRYKVYQKRMSKYNRSKGHGVHYSQNERKLRAEWAERMAKSKPLI